LRPNFYELGVEYIAVPERRPLEKEEAGMEYISEQS
ncbi:unnamed protein product, partial [marine sediment metagenome]